MNANEPAFPIPEQHNPYGEITQVAWMGLTKRELFAAMAMQGILAKSNRFDSSEQYAAWAVHDADALIAELSKPK